MAGPIQPDRCRRPLLGAALLLWAALPALSAPPPIRCPATRDVWISAVEGERDFNMGRAPRLKLKVWQEFALVEFDVAALAGKTIRRAFLYLRPDGGHRLGLNGGSDLRWLTVSTVSHEWQEGRSVRAGRDLRGHGATFLESSHGRRGWGFDGARIWDVILGNGNSLRFDGQLEPVDGARRGWLRIELDPRLVRALVAGASHGLALMDGSTDVGTNCYIRSRESGEGPYLEVETGAEDLRAPESIARLEVRPAAEWATPALGAAEIVVDAPSDAFALDLTLDGRPVGRWQIPFPDRSAAPLTFPVQDLSPDRELVAALTVVDEAGNRSRSVSATGRSSAPLSVPRLAEMLVPAGGDPPRLGGATVWALPEVTEVDPVSGAIQGETDGAAFRRGNVVWDGASRTIRLAAARGEIVSFQIAVEGRATGCGLEVSQLEGPATIPASRVRLWRNWYVGRHPEVALPLTQPFDLPAADNAVPGQSLQAVTVDLAIPTDAPAGDYRGSVVVFTATGATELDLRLRVYDVVLPEEIHFNVELNAYRGPGRAGGQRFVDSFRLAHYHRATINRVPYGQDGAVHDDWIPEIDENGRVIDWSRFDAGLGGLLDGSWFADNPRAGVPVPVLYLPLFEGWPTDFRAHYRAGLDAAALDPRQVAVKRRHDLLAPPIEEALAGPYRATMTATIRDFAAHFRERGWDRTLFQFYLNNKYRYGYSLWDLDEPFEYLDWAALNFFAKILRDAVDDPEVYSPEWHRALGREGLAALDRRRPTILFRADVSRPMWQGSVSDGLINALYVSGTGFELPRLLRRTKQRMPALLSAYGSANPVERSNWESVAWCLHAFARGFDGVLTWQSLGGVEALRRPVRTALLIDAGRHGHAVASLRLHALRRGAQDSELLRLLQLRNGWSRERIDLLLAETVGAPADRGGTTAAVPATGQALRFYRLKEGVLRLLTSPSRPVADPEEMR